MSNPNDFNKQIIKEFRSDDGKVGGFFEGVSLLLLHTTGAKTGAKRVNPLVCFEDGDRIIVCASKGGAPSHPDWYYNLVANPMVEVEYGTEKFTARAKEAIEPERAELYRRMINNFANFAEYEKMTARVIPVITLSRV